MSRDLNNMMINKANIQIIGIHSYAKVYHIFY